VRSRAGMLDWYLHQWAQRAIGPLTRIRIGDAQPVRRLVGPVAHHYKREWGPWAQDTRFAAATVAPTLLTLADREGVLKRREAAPAPPHSTSTPTIAARVQIFTDEAVNDGIVKEKVCHSQGSPNRSTPSRSGESIKYIYLFTLSHMPSANPLFTPTHFVWSEGVFLLACFNEHVWLRKVHRIWKNSNA
jgi:hypothetical protein